MRTTGTVRCGPTLVRVAENRHYAGTALAALYFAALLAVVFWPSPVDRGAAGALAWYTDWFQGRGFPAWLVGYRTLEFGANVVLFVPLGAILARWRRKGRWWLPLLAGATASGLVEAAQALLLPGRVAAWSDIAANTLGAVLGFALVRAACRNKG